MTIRAAVLHAPGQPFRIEDVVLQAPRKGEVLVKVAAVGVCHSDWHLVTGDTKHPFPLVAGHEGAGYVSELGDDVTGLQKGDLVALNWAPSCGDCYYCHAGRPALCATYVEPIWAGTMIDGSTRLSFDGQPLYHYSALACFADYCVVPSQCCVKLPEDLDPEIAAVIGCAVATGVGSVLNTAKVPSGASVAVIGAGGVGLSTIMGANAVGAGPILAIDPLPSRRNAALELGATHTSEQSDLVYELTDNRGMDFVFEAVGKPELQELAFQICRPGGTVVLSGLSPNGSCTNIPGARLVREEKTVMGSYYGTCDAKRDFPQYARMYADGVLPLDRMVSHRYSLDQINEAYADMLAGKSTRGVIRF